MPQAPEYLRKMFTDDQAAFKVIDANFNTSPGGIISPKVVGHDPTEQENYALDYLWLEWDYGFSGFTAPEPETLVERVSRMVKP